jgi:hypothetical protein
VTARTLRLAEDLTLPLEAITQTFGILAVRGAGKTNTAAVMAEGMYDAGLPFVVVDPVGSWWGLRAAGDGKAAGLSIPIFGGAHGDVPLEQTGGALLADLVVDDRLTCVLDVSDFSETQKTRFLLDFAERLYRRNRDPLHLFLEEADDYAPQRPMREQARLLRAWENIVRRGRARGLGITMITQRSAALNKNVLTQIETLIVLRTTSPQDRKAIAGWVDYHGQAHELLDSLPGLADGEAWLWSPSWLQKLERLTVRRRRTFDSGATPKDVRGARRATTLAEVDLEAVRTRMAATIERAKQEDPKELRRQLADRDRLIRSLEKAGQVKQSGVSAPVPQVKTVEVPVLTAKQVQAFERGAARLEKVGTQLVEVGGQVVTVARALVEAAQRAAGGNGGPSPHHPITPRVKHPVPVSRPHMRGQNPTPRPTTSLEGLGRSAQRILNALAWLEGIGLERADKTQVALLADQSPTSGGYFNNLGKLRSAGLIDYPVPSVVQLTDAGRAVASPVDVPTSSEELHQQLYARLPGAQTRILAEVISRYPSAITKDALAEASGQSPTSGGYFNNLGRLRSLGLIDYPRPGQVVALPVLFLEAGR